MEDLKAYLQTRPEITEVWLNDAGQWCFSPNNQFPVRVTREEILGQESDSKKDKTKK